jgi:hypothetical protein
MFNGLPALINPIVKQKKKISALVASILFLLSFVFCHWRWDTRAIYLCHALYLDRNFHDQAPRNAPPPSACHRLICDNYSHQFSTCQ